LLQQWTTEFIPEGSCSFDSDMKMHLQDESSNAEKAFEKSVNPDIDQNVCTVLTSFPEKNESRLGTCCLL
jgi:hypothetical protein